MKKNRFSDKTSSGKRRGKIEDWVSRATVHLAASEMVLIAAHRCDQLRGKKTGMKRGVTLKRVEREVRRLFPSKGGRNPQLYTQLTVAGPERRAPRPLRDFIARTLERHLERSIDDTKRLRPRAVEIVTKILERGSKPQRKIVQPVSAPTMSQPPNPAAAEALTVTQARNQEAYKLNGRVCQNDKEFVVRDQLAYEILLAVGETRGRYSGLSDPEVAKVYKIGEKAMLHLSGMPMSERHDGPASMKFKGLSAALLVLEDVHARLRLRQMALEDSMDHTSAADLNARVTAYLGVLTLVRVAHARLASTTSIAPAKHTANEAAA